MGGFNKGGQRGQNKGGQTKQRGTSMVKIMISMPVGFQSQQIKSTGAIYRMFPLFHFGGGKKFSPYGCPPTMCFSCGVIGQEKVEGGERGERDGGYHLSSLYRSQG